MHVISPYALSLWLHPLNSKKTTGSVSILLEYREDTTKKTRVKEVFKTFLVCVLGQVISIEDRS